MQSQNYPALFSRVLFGLAIGGFTVFPDAADAASCPSSIIGNQSNSSNELPGIGHIALRGCKDVDGTLSCEFVLNKTAPSTSRYYLGREWLSNVFLSLPNTEKKLDALTAFFVTPQCEKTDRIVLEPGDTMRVDVVFPSASQVSGEFKLSMPSYEAGGLRYLGQIEFAGRME